MVVYHRSKFIQSSNIINCENSTFVHSILARIDINTPNIIKRLFLIDDELIFVLVVDIGYILSGFNKPFAIVAIESCLRLTLIKSILSHCGHVQNLKMNIVNAALRSNWIEPNEPFHFFLNCLVAKFEHVEYYFFVRDELWQLFVNEWKVEAVAIVKRWNICN